MSSPSSTMGNQYRCEKCGSTFNSLDELEDHNRKKHRK
ncbi:MAG: C2H2-type zinc finger protein [Nitrososphaeraceae archaeon]